MSNRSVSLVCSSDVERGQKSNDPTCVEAMIARVKSAYRVVWFCICRSSHVHPLPLLQGSGWVRVRGASYRTTMPLSHYAAQIHHSFPRTAIGTASCISYRHPWGLLGEHECQAYPLLHSRHILRNFYQIRA